MTDLSTETREFLEAMEAKLAAELAAVDEEAARKKADITARIEDLHTAMSAIARLSNVSIEQTFRPVVVRTPRPKLDAAWHDKLLGLNQRDAVVRIAQEFNRKLDVSTAADIMRSAGKLQGQFADDKAAAETRVAWLARKSNQFKELNNRTFELVA